MKITPKQAELYKRIIEPVSNEIIVQGSVQSGKTFIITYSLLDYAKGVYENYPDTKYNGAIVGWDLDTLKRNIVTPLQTFLDEKGYKNEKDYELKYGGNDKYFKFLNMTFYFFSFNNKLSFNKILGGPLLFIWVDEAARIYSNNTLQESFDELPGRQMSFVGHPFKKTIHSFNVEGNENHPYKKKYIDGKPDAIHFKFDPLDNPQIDTDKKVEEVIRLFPEGSLREQKIFNKWVVSEGRVFNSLNIIDSLDNLKITEIGIGCDYGSVNPTTFVPIALCFDTEEHRWKLVRLECYYHDPGINGEKPTTAFYVEQFKSFVKYLIDKYKVKVTCNIVDSEATHYTNALFNSGVDYTAAKKGAGSVDKGVQQLQSLIYKKVFYILKADNINYFDIEKKPVFTKDESLLEFESYQYDTIKSLNTGVNCYKKEKDHSVDRHTLYHRLLARYRQMPSYIGVQMEIKCPRTKKFHFKINIEEYISDLEKIGIEQQTPIIITIPCSKCKMIETYEIFKNRVLIKSEPNKFHK